jgi:hypothetical protein
MFFNTFEDNIPCNSAGAKAINTYLVNPSLANLGTIVSLGSCICFFHCLSSFSPPTPVALRARGSFLFAADGIALNNKKIADGCLPAKSLMRAVNFFGTLHGARQNRQFYLRPSSLCRKVSTAAAACTSTQSARGLCQVMRAAAASRKRPLSERQTPRSDYSAQKK